MKFTVIGLIAVSMVGVGYFLIAGVGKPIGSDLSVIGKGKPSLVLAYENFSPTGGEALNRLRKIRSKFDARLEFVVADLGTPQGRAFADRFQIVDAQAVMLSQDGQALTVTGIPVDAEALRSQLEASLSSIE